MLGVDRIVCVYMCDVGEGGVADTVLKGVSFYTEGFD